MARAVRKGKSGKSGQSRRVGQAGGGSSKPKACRTILIVDDNQEVRQPLAAWLAARFKNHRVIEAGDGKSCLKLAALHGPQLVLMDVRLPGMSGIETTRRIMKSLPGTQVIMLSAHDDQAYRTDAAAAGAKKYVLKSRVHRELLPAIREALAP